MGSKTSSKNFSPTILAFSPPFSSFFPSLLPPRYYFWPNAQLHLTQAAKGHRLWAAGHFDQTDWLSQASFFDQSDQSNTFKKCLHLNTTPLISRLYDDEKGKRQNHTTDIAFPLMGPLQSPCLSTLPIAKLTCDAEEEFLIHVIHGNAKEQMPDCELLSKRWRGGYT